MPYGAELMSTDSELLTSHEPYFLSNVSLENANIFCGDERKALYNEAYLHVFGGVANAAFNAVVMTRATDTTPFATTFCEAVRRVAADCRVMHIKAGVHSDTHAETTGHLALEGDAPIGCGYIKLRAAISQMIGKDPDKIVGEAERLRPELFSDPADTSFAHTVVATHRELAADTAFFGEGSRAVAAAAIEAGAPSMLVDGDHVAHEGIINLRPGTAIDSNQAAAADRSVYVHGAWVGGELVAQLPALQPLGGKQWEIAELIDTIGTMWALGVDTIAVRR